MTIEVGDIVKVINVGETYSTYRNFFDYYKAELSTVRPMWIDGADPDPRYHYKVIFKGYHTPHSTEAPTVCVIENIVSKQIYLIGIEGLNKIKKTKGGSLKMEGSGKLTMNFGGISAGEEVKIVKESAATYLIDKNGDGKELLTVPKKLMTGVALSSSGKKIGEYLSEEEGSTLDSLLSGSKSFSKKEETVKEVEETLPPLGDNQIYFTDITGGRLPTSKLNHVIDIYPDDHFPEEIRCDIPVVDPNYYWDTDVLETLILAHQLNKKALLTGLPGTGKSSAIRQFAGIIKQPYMRFNGKDGIEPSSFLGYPWATKEGMEWKDGLLPIGCKMGYLVTIDEVFKLNAGIQMAMQCLYEDGGHLLLDEKPGSKEEKQVIPTEDFRMFMTDNVKGTGDNLDMFAATQIQDTSTLDRFALVQEVDYLGEVQEIDMLASKYTSANKKILRKLIQFANLVRNGYRKGEISVTLSLRGLFTICELMEKGLDGKMAIGYAFLNKLGEDDERRAVNEFFRTVGL